MPTTTLPSMSQAPPTRRRWFQFGLGTMLLLVTVFAVWLGWELSYIRERRAYAQGCADRGRPCVFVSEASAQGLDKLGVALPTIPIWRRWLGDEAVVLVGLPTTDFSKPIDPATQQQFMDDCERLFPEHVRLRVN